MTTLEAPITSGEVALGSLRRHPATARRMADAARRFLDSLQPNQRATASLPFADPRRRVWDYRPVEDTPRNGLRLMSMTPAQRACAMELAETGLSERGAAEVRQIMALEDVLRELEPGWDYPNHYARYPLQYAFAIFGTPGGGDPWAWQVGGHHVGLHYTIVDREWIAPVPLFLGANPATVLTGPHSGLRTLGAEEDLARALLGSLETAQKAVAIVSPTPPDDILTDAYRSAEPFASPRGIPFAALDGGQRDYLARLVRHYVERSVDGVAAAEWRAIEEAGLESVTFAWQGSEARGQGHYYAVKGPTFLIEYDNTQNGANHIHSVWRDFTNDWGGDLLAGHYRQAHRAAAQAADSGGARK